MIFGRASIAGTSIKSFKLTGGLNEQVSNIELNPGELTDCKNYIEVDDKYHGYESLKGYERYDGQTSPSSIDLDSVDPIIDTSREAQRALIGAVPGSGSISGLHIYDDNVYSFRNAVGDLVTEMYVDSATGWNLVDTSSVPLSPNGKTRAVTGRFSEYQTNSEVMIWVDGVSQPHVYNGTTVTEIDMGTILGAPFTTTFPQHVGIWKNRVFLAYPDGHILFSEVGDPTKWDASLGLAGEIYIGDPVTNILEAPGGVLLFFTQDQIKMLTYSGSSLPEFSFRLDDFPKGIGARPDTVMALTGSIYFGDDRGFSSIEASDVSGGFSANILGKKVDKTYLKNLNNISGSTVDRNTNRYLLFYDDVDTGESGGLVFTFNNKRLKGAGKIVLDHRVTTVTEGSFTDGSSKIFFGGTTGFVYQFQSGTSFDGGAIATGLTTSYHHYGSPRSWKRFRRLTFEMDAQTGTEFTIASDFDYGNRDLKKPLEQDITLTTGSGVWGSSIWGAFLWGSDILNRKPLYINGYGASMSISISTSEKYRTEHIVHNITTDYSVKGVQA